MPETWHLRDTAGQPCGPGTRRALSTTVGAVTATQDLSSEHTWNRVESRRWLAAGVWSVTLSITTVGTSPTRVSAVIERRDANCIVLQTLLDRQSGDLSLGVTESVTLSQTTTQTVGFASGDVLTLRVRRSQGTSTTTLRFNAIADSNLINPDLAAPVVALAEAGVSAGGSVSAGDSPAARAGAAVSARAQATAKAVPTIVTLVTGGGGGVPPAEPEDSTGSITIYSGGTIQSG